MDQTVGNNVKAYRPCPSFFFSVFCKKELGKDEMDSATAATLRAKGRYTRGQYMVNNHLFCAAISVLRR